MLRECGKLTVVFFENEVKYFRVCVKVYWRKQKIFLLVGPRLCVKHSCVSSVINFNVSPSMLSAAPNRSPLLQVYLLQFYINI